MEHCAQVEVNVSTQCPSSFVTFTSKSQQIYLRQRKIWKNLLTLCDFVCVANGGTNNGTYGWHGHAIFSLHTKDEVSYEQYDLKVSALFKKRINIIYGTLFDNSRYWPRELLYISTQVGLQKVNTLTLDNSLDV